MTRFTLHVPEAFNDGTPVGQDTFELIENALLNIGGGFTLTHGIGAWRGDNEVYREHVRLYAVDSDDVNTGARLLKLAHRVGTALRQEAVYVTQQAIATQLVFTQVTA